MPECVFRGCQEDAAVRAIFEFSGFEIEGDVCSFHLVLLQATEGVTYEGKDDSSTET